MALARTFLSGLAVTASLVSFAVAGTGVAYVARISPDLPSHVAVTEWKAREGTTILAEDGTVLGVHAREFRKFVPFDKIPKRMVDAFVAAEDGNYWTHHGVDPKGIVRAALANFRGGRVEGGSTITQQVVKNLVLTSQRSIDRKIREALIALKIDKELGKERILEIYANEIFLGSNAYGAAAAAEVYFGKTLDQLTLAEAATIAGLPQAPSAANPFSRPAKAVERRNYVIGRMLALGMVTKDDADAALRQTLATVPRVASNVPGGPEPAFWYPEESVRRMLVDSFGTDRIYGEGGVVRTTIRPSLQRIVHQELRAGIVREDRQTSKWRGPLARGDRMPVDWASEDMAPPSGAEDWKIAVVVEAGKDATVVTADGRIVLRGDDMAWATSSRRASKILAPGDRVLVGDVGRGPELVQVPETQGAVVVMEPSTGSVLALDGGFSHEISEFNRATQAKRQTGSIFKPFVYLAATEFGYDATSPLLDSPIALSQGAGLADWRPQGGEKGLGLITLRRALENSRNMATVRLMYDVGEDRVRDVAGRAGLTLPTNLGFAMALGVAEQSPVAMAAAFSSIANGGHRVAPAFYLPAPGAPEAAQPPQVFDPVAVAQISSMLEGVVHYGTARRAFDGFDHPLAAKTGTTNDARDAWFAAYGPEFVAVAWIGRDDHGPLSKDSSGGGTVAPIMRRILDAAAAGGSLKFEPFTLPEGAETVRADRDTGLLDEEGDVVEIVRNQAPLKSE
jgi:penicillin-binding protein 1A